MPGSAQPILSVIVPVCNVERYLPQALDSLLAQTMPAGQMEIICVNDGSTDSSGAILRDYAAVERRFPITVIEQPRNLGYGCAMNTGLAQARGRYVGFLEPDDFIDAAGFKELLEVAASFDADVVKANYFDHFEAVSPDRLEEALCGYRYHEALCAAEDERVLFIRPCLWTAVYRRSLIEENDIRFNETPGASYQDTAFAFQVFVAAERLVLVPEAYVHYRLDNMSSSIHSTKKDFWIYDEIALIESFVNAKAEHRDRFAAATVYKSFWLHRWNCNRIGSDDSRRIADTLMSAKLKRAQAEGVLERRFFDDDEWAEVQRLLLLRFPDKVEEEYRSSWSYRIGHALLTPARVLSRRAGGGS